MSVRLVFILLCVVLNSVSQVYAEAGVNSGSIRFGQTAAISGPAEKLGTGMRDGLLAAFGEINEQGGIAGRKLELITLDDGYEPDRAVQNLRTLIRQENVFAMAGVVGTPVSQALEPITTAAKIPYIAPFTGAEFLRHPYKRYVVNVRPSYYQETEEIARYLVNHKGYKKIAIMYQDDSFGRTGLEGLKRALSRRDLSLVSEATYARNTIAVKRAVLEIKNADAEAVVMVGAYQPLAAYVRLCRALKLNIEFATLSFAGSEALAAELGPDGQGVMVTQAVPYPFDLSAPLSVSYRRALKKTKPDAEFGYISFEGYIAGRLIGAVLQEMGQPITREAFIDTLAARKEIIIDGLVLTFGPHDNQGLEKIYSTVLSAKGTVDAYPYGAETTYD